MPLVVLSNHASYVYDSSFESWTLVASSASLPPHFPASDMRSELTLFQRTAEQQAAETDHVSTLSATAAVTSPSVPLSLLAAMDPRTRVLQTLAHLENEVSQSLQRGDAVAYRQSLTSLVAKLVSHCPSMHSALLRLAEICRELRGPAGVLISVAAPALEGAAIADMPPRWQPFVLVSAVWIYCCCSNACIVAIHLHRLFLRTVCFLVRDCPSALSSLHCCRFCSPTPPCTHSWQKWTHETSRSPNCWQPLRPPASFDSLCTLTSYCAPRFLECLLMCARVDIASNS
jgi:hypothetical protein